MYIVRQQRTARDTLSINNGILLYCKKTQARTDSAIEWWYVRLSGSNENSIE